MSGLRTSAKYFLYGSPLYRPARKAFLAVFDRKKLKALNLAQYLYGQFMGRGDLVFDVGANVGEYTDTFLSLGARVVAVEPNPVCANWIKRMEATGSVLVERVAIGDHEGFAELSISKWDVISTLSEDWKLQVVRSGRWGKAPWESSVCVPVTTLDALFIRHGPPQFIKIDTEGFDDKVLDGMSFRPPTLSFEFIVDLLHVARRSLEILGDGYLYNYVVGQHFRLESPSWLTAAEMAQTLERVSCPENYGDIIAKRLNS